MSGLDVLDADEEKQLAQLIEDTYARHVMLVQSTVRRFIQRLRIHEYIAAKYEKIYDPRRKIYYYYNIQSDKSSWKKPKLLLHADMTFISPTYTLDEAAIMIQRTARKRIALKAVRALYKSVVTEAVDASSGGTYYHNKKSGVSAWKLPGFMNGIYDHKYEKGGEKKEVVPVVEEEEDSVHDDSSDDSNDSEDSEAARMKRVLARKHPRSKVQGLVDINEDNMELTELNLTGIGAVRFTSRLYDLTTLTHLDLSHNKLKLISPNIQYLECLERLDFSYNQVARLPESMKELVNLKALIGSHNQLRGYPGYLYTIASLTELDMSHNLFRSIPMEIGNLELLKETKKWEVGIGLLTALKRLDFSYCKLTDWPDQIELLKGLEHLDFSHNIMEDVAVFILGSLRALKHLDLSFNRIKEMPKEIYAVPLRTLHLNNNLLEALPAYDENGVMNNIGKALTDLDLSYNRIEVLEKEIGFFKKLKRLKVSNNQLEVVNEEIQTLNKLEMLDFSFNKICTLPAGLSSCRELNWLSVSNNELSIIPISLGSFHKLETLNMSHNLIFNPHTSEMATAFYGMKNLKTLDLSHNQLTHLPTAFYSMKTVQTLDLSHNSLTSLSKDLGLMTSLSSLTAQFNKLKTLPTGIAGCFQELRTIAVNNNSITFLPTSLSALKSLNVLVLHHNDLKAFPRQLYLLPKIQHLDVSWNKDVKGSYIDEDARDCSYDYSRDFICLPTMKRLLEKAWEKLQNIPGNVSAKNVPDSKGRDEKGVNTARTKRNDDMNKINSSINGNVNSSGNTSSDITLKLPSINNNSNSNNNTNNNSNNSNNSSSSGGASHVFSPTSKTPTTDSAREKIKNKINSESNDSNSGTLNTLLHTAGTDTVGIDPLPSSSRVDEKRSGDITADVIFLERPWTQLLPEIRDFYEKLALVGKEGESNTENNGKIERSADSLESSPIISHKKEKTKNNRKNKVLQTIEELNRWNDVLYSHFKDHNLEYFDKNMREGIVNENENRQRIAQNLMRLNISDNHNDNTESSMYGVGEYVPHGEGRFDHFDEDHDGTSITNGDSNNSNNGNISSSLIDSCVDINSSNTESKKNGEKFEEDENNGKNSITVKKRKGVDDLYSLQALHAKEWQRSMQRFSSLFVYLGLSPLGEPFAQEGEEGEGVSYPDIKYSESLDLGYKEHECVMMFERLAREVHAIAMHRKHAHLQAVYLAREMENRPQKRPLTPVIPTEKKVKKFNMKSEGNFLKKKEKKRGSSPDKRVGSAEVENVEETDSEEEKEPVIIVPDNIDKTPYFNKETKTCTFIESSFFSLWNYSLHDADFFQVALRCYSGLSSSLLRRADKISIAIRTVEKKHKLKVSVLNIAQRLGGDYLDLMGHLLPEGPLSPVGVNEEKEQDDEYRAVEVAQPAIQIKSLMKGSTYNDKAEKKKAPTVASVDTDTDTDVDDDQMSKKEKKEKKLKKKKQKEEKDKKNKDKKEQERLREDEYERKRNLKAAAAVAAQKAIIKQKEKSAVAAATVQYLQEQRRRVLVWAAAASDAGSQLLAFSGWDPLSPAFHLKDSSDPSFNPPPGPSRGGPQCVDPWAQDLHFSYIQLSHTRGRIYQGLEYHSKAQIEFRAVLKLSKGQESATIELVKCLMVIGEAHEPTVLLYNLTRKIHPTLFKTTKNYGENPFPEEILQVDKRIGSLLLLLENMSGNQRALGIGSVMQKHVFNVQDNGLLIRPVSTACELIHGRSLSTYTLAEKMARKEEEDEKTYEDNRASAALQRSARDAIALSREMMRECDDVITEAHLLKAPSRAGGLRPGSRETSSREAASRESSRLTISRDTSMLSYGGDQDSRPGTGLIPESRPVSRLM